MANLKNSIKKIEVAYTLLGEDVTTIQKFEYVSTLIKGINPTVDKHLKNCAEAIVKLKKLQEGDILDLSKDLIPVNTEQEKKRKKILLTFINSWNQLRGEVKLLNEKLQDVSVSKDDLLTGQNVVDFRKIITGLKGPFGMITIAAVLISGGLIFLNTRKTPTVLNQISTEPAIKGSEKSKIKVIVVDGRQIPLTEVREVTGAECDGELHYHAKSNAAAKALDGTQVAEISPTGCGFGKVGEVAIEEAEQ